MYLNLYIQREGNIYIEREREREKDKLYMYITYAPAPHECTCIYIYIYVYIDRYTSCISLHVTSAMAICHGTAMADGMPPIHGSGLELMTYMMDI